MTPLNESVFGVTPNTGLRDSPVPLSEMGVFGEKPVAVVLRRTSLERGPGDVGAKTAVKVKLLPDETVTGS